MNPYSRPSPWAALPASNPQTNPTRTNNQRRTSQDYSPYSTTPPYGDRGFEESEGEIMSRGEQMAEPAHKQYQKINQVIQVPTIPAPTSQHADMLIFFRTSTPKQLLPSSHLAYNCPRATTRMANLNRINGYGSLPTL